MIRLGSGGLGSGGRVGRQARQRTSVLPRAFMCVFVLILRSSDFIMSLIAEYETKHTQLQ